MVWSYEQKNWKMSNKMAAGRPFCIWHYLEYHLYILHYQNPLFESKTNQEQSLYLDLFWSYEQKFENVKQNGHQSAILNLTSSALSPLDSAYLQTPSPNQERSLYLYLFWSYEQKFKCQTKWPPVGHFESDIVSTISTRFGIPPNPFFESRTESLSLFVLKLWAKMLKMSNKMAAGRPFWIWRHWQYHH